MKVLRDPREWAMSVVGTMPRLMLLLAAQAVVLASIVMTAMDGSVRSAVIQCACLVWFQYLQLEALRRIVVPGHGDGSAVGQE